jgi:hypothetical protein
MCRACGTYGGERTSMQVFSGETWRDHLEDLGAYGRITLKSVLKKSVRRARIGLIWLRIGTGDVLF